MNRLVLALALTLIPVSEALTQLPSQSPPTPAPDGSLVSPTTGIDYTPLRALLQNQQWRLANEKTAELMLKAGKRNLQGWVSPQDIEELSCWDLKTIDDLWKQYSDGRFGFSVQFPIFIETGNRPGRLVNVEAYESFGDRIGWRKQGEWIAFKENLTYSLTAPLGHLPNPRQAYQITGGRLQYVTLAQRLVACGLVSPAPTPTFQPRRS